jgi:predicted amidohydrolase YtcJ
MMRIDTGRWTVTLASLLLSAHALAAGVILQNGQVYTANPRQPWAQAVAMRDGKFVFVGSNAQAHAFADPGARVIDLQGKTVLPGIIDSHIHTSLGEFLLHRLCNVRSYSVDEGYSKLAACAKSAPPGDWVIAYGWYFTDNQRIGDVSLARLDAIVPDRKLAVVSLDLHSMWLNSKALREFKISRDTPDPAGGRIERDPRSGEPTGVLRDAAHDSVLDAVLHHSTYTASTVDLFRTAVPYLNGLGITAVIDAMVDEDMEAAFHRLDADGKLTMHVSLAFPVNPANFRTEIPRIAAKRAQQTPHTRIDFVKVFADGNIEDNLASMLAHDGHPATPGYYTQQQMNELVRLAEHNKLNVFVHAIGDGATRQVLDAVAAARHAGPCPSCRHSLTHLQWVDSADIPRFKSLNVIANIQEGWLAPRAFGGPVGYDYVTATGLAPIGPTMAAQMLPYGPLHSAGARIAGGSDWFFTNENPWQDIEAGATSRDPGEATQKAMLPKHVVDQKALVDARTIDAAYQMFSESRIGSIEVGKSADLVVIDRNVLKIPARDIHATQVVMTFFEGKQIAGAAR